MSGSPAKHHKLHGLTGLVTIVTLPLILIGLVRAVPNGIEGLLSWMSSPLGAISLLVFATAALLYVKAEFEELILDYFDGGMRSTALLANKGVAGLTWIAIAFSVLKTWLGA